MIKSTVVLGTSLLVVGAAHAVSLFSDDFNGNALNPAWEVQRGYAAVADGWVSLHGSTPGTRDAFIQTAVGSDWADYRLTTRFNPMGGGDDWYHSLIKFRVQESYGWEQGSFYLLWINTPSWPDEGRNTVNFIRSVDHVWSDIQTFRPAPGVLNDEDNIVEIVAVGGDFKVKINGQRGGHFHDDDPLLTGGIALGAVWESTTRYDYAYVNSVPEPATWALMLAGLGAAGLAARRRTAATA